MEDNIVLTMRGICMTFPGVKALDNVDFTLRKGEIHALIGENGAEKSLYRKTRRVTSKTKPLWLHECGLIPTEEQLKKTPWGSFMTWHTEYLMDTNTKEQLSQLYNSEYVITLDELPSFA